MKIRRLVLIAVIAALVLLSWYAWGPSHTPPGQPALASLTKENFSSFKDSFNDASDRIRMVLLLSPT